MYFYTQTIGFIDTLHGWTGGNSVLFETTDGGKTWKNNGPGSAYNRFFRVNDSLAFLAGDQIYRYAPWIIDNVNEQQPFDDIHNLSVSPNPTNDKLNIKLTIKNKTNCQLQLFSTNGKLLQTIYNTSLVSGTYDFSISLEKYPNQILFLVLKTNEGLIYERVVKKQF